jgi:hypothetical protein
MIKKIIEEIRQQQELTKKEIVPDARTINTQLGNIKRAEKALTHLFIDLRNEVKSNLVLILVGGKHSEEFSKIAEESFACLTFEADAVFKEMASGVDDMFLGKSATPGIFDIAMGGMSDISHEIGIVGYNYVQFKSEDAIQINDRKDLVNLIANAFNREIGAELVVLKAVHDATIKIMDSDFNGKKVPVILHSDNKQLMSKIAEDAPRATKNVFVVNVTQKPTNKSVESKLVELSKQAQEV